MKIKYFGDYYGPSYGGFHDLESMDAFTSLKEAKSAMFLRQGGHDYTTTYKENEDGLYVPWSRGRYVQFPSTTSSDAMELYAAFDQGDGEYSMAAEPTYRLNIGPRGGIVVEAYCL